MSRFKCRGYLNCYFKLSLSEESEQRFLQRYASEKNFMQTYASNLTSPAQHEWGKIIGKLAWAVQTYASSSAKL
jgi:hypothetical protein